MSIRYLTRPAMWPLSHGEWALADDLIQYDTAANRLRVIPGGTRVNGASIPWLFWPIVGHPFTSWYIYPSVAHDAAYAEKPFTRKEADEEFHRGLLSELDRERPPLRFAPWRMRVKRDAARKVGRAAAWTMYAAVRVGGGKHYNRART